MDDGSGEPTGGSGPGDSVSGLVDWELATSTARRLAKLGPEVTRSEADAVVEELAELAEIAVGHVARITGLTEPAPARPARVVDRGAWVEANVAGLDALLTPVVSRLADRRPPGRLASSVGARLTGLQAGAVLAFLSGKVLGQYEIFGPDGGVLLLVAPNIVEAERSLGVDPRDFRLWVCLHEVTHRVQFTVVPWLRGHLSSEVDRLAEATELDPDALRERALTGLRELGRAMTGDGVGGQGLLALIQNPAQREILDRLTAFMSLVEGHAEYVMDAVSADVIPSIPTIRARFQERRRGTGPADRLLRRLLGLEVKMRQYSEGSSFVRGVVAAIGIDGFNAVWSAPETLPTRAELSAPLDWVERVHGVRPAASA
ncbi:MAG: zinc-dependent metalloprotease [Actinobacteria bacterium]|nr:zinc-dependent metalloprotease [Actinomycetota bacterium]